MKALLLNNWKLKVMALLLASGLWFYVYMEHTPSVIATHQVKIVYENAAESLHIKRPRETVDVRFKGNPNQIENLKPNEISSVADLSGLGPGTHRVKLRIRKNTSAEVVDRELSVSVTLEKLNSIERPLDVIPIGSLPVDKRLGAVKPGREVVRLYGYENALNKVQKATLSLYLAEQKTNFSIKLPVEARDRFGNIVDGVYSIPESVDVRVVVTNANTRIVPITLSIIGKAAIQNKAVPDFDPKTVTLFGDEQALEKTMKIPTEEFAAERCRPGAVFSLQLALPRNVFTTANHVTVSCHEPVIVSRKFIVDIKPINVPESLKADANKDKIEVTITGDSTIVDALKLNEISAQLDLGRNGAEGEQFVTPRVTVSGKGESLNLQYDHAPIKVVLERK